MPEREKIRQLLSHLPVRELIASVLKDGALELKILRTLPLEVLGNRGLKECLTDILIAVCFPFEITDSFSKLPEEPQNITALGKEEKGELTAFERYLKDILEFPLMGREEEQSCFKELDRIRRKTERISPSIFDENNLPDVVKKMKKKEKEIEEKIVTANLRFVIMIAKKFIGLGLPLNDLVAEGNKGLLEALRRFDYKRGYKFISYAVWWIRQAIREAISENRLIRIPADRVILRGKVVRKTRELYQKGLTPSVRELAGAVECSEREIESTLKIIAEEQTISLESLITNDGKEEISSLIEDKAFPPPDEVAEVRLRVGELLGLLPEGERKVIEARFGIDRDDALTLEKTGRIIGPSIRKTGPEGALTRQRIKQIEKKALERIQKRIRKETQKA